MAEDNGIRYITPNGLPPNGGVTFDKIHVGVRVQPNPSYHVPPPTINTGYYTQFPPPNINTGYYTHPPTINSGHPAPPPPYYPPPNPTVHPEPPRPDAPAPTERVWDPPGQYIDDCKMQGDGWTLIVPKEITRFYFLWDGTRPCDYHLGYYAKAFNFVEHRVFSGMTVEDLMDQLGVPHKENDGIEEMDKSGENRYVRGLCITRGSPHAGMTLAQVGWSARRSAHRPVWLMVKR